MFILCLLIVIAGFDIRQRRIPLVCISVGFFYWLCETGILLVRGKTEYRDCIGCLLAAGIIMIICQGMRMVDRDSIGLGDVLLLGIFTLLTWEHLFVESLLFTCVIFFLWSVLLLARGYSRKATLPFAPFLCMGYGIALCIWFLGS